MDPSTTTSPQLPACFPANFSYLVGLLLLGPLLALHLGLASNAYDDAYIHMRIARNALFYGQPYYNLDEAVFSTSSPLWTLLLTALFSVLGASAKSVAILNACILSVLASSTCLLCSTYLRSCSRTRCGLIALLVIALSHQASIGLMETPLALLLLFLGLYHLLRARYSGFSLLTLACFARPEMLIFLVVALVLVARQTASFTQPRVKVLARVLLWVLLPLLPLSGLCLVYYGSLVPHTLQAKSLVYQLSTAEALQIFMRTLLGEELARSNKLLSAVYALSLFLVAALSVPALLTEHNKQPRAPQLALPLALLLPALLVLIAYAAKRILLFPWYMPLLLTPAMLALLLSQRQRAGVVSRVSALLLLFLCCVPSLISLGQNFYALAGHPQYASDFLSSARVRRYLEIGKDLQAKAPSATLLAPEIGALGFAFSGKIVDAVGLVSPEALAFHPLAVPAQRSSGMLGAIPPELVQQVQPDYIVSMELFAEALLRSEQVSQYQIEKVSTFTEEDLLRAAGRRLWDGSELLVLSKNAH